MGFPRGRHWETMALPWGLGSAGSRWGVRSQLNNIGIMLLPCGIFATAVSIAGPLRIPKNVSLQWYALFLPILTKAFAVRKRFEIPEPMPL